MSAPNAEAYVEIAASLLESGYEGEATSVLEHLAKKMGTADGGEEEGVTPEPREAQAGEDELLGLGKRLLEWHSGYSDPICQTGKLLVSGKQDDISLDHLERTSEALETVRAQGGLSDENEFALVELIADVVRFTDERR